MPNLKYIFFTALVVVFFYCGCKNAPQTPKEKAAKLIASVFEARENHTYGYKAGAFGKLDSAYSTYRDDSLCRPFMDSVSTYLDKGTMAFAEVAEIGYRTDTTTNKFKKEKLWKELLVASAKQKKNNDRADFYSSKVDSLRKNYKPFFKGWKIEHEYRANNAFGIPVSQKTTFYFDVALAKITGPEEIVKFIENKR